MAGTPAIIIAAGSAIIGLRKCLVQNHAITPKAVASMRGTVRQPMVTSASPSSTGCMSRRIHTGSCWPSASMVMTQS